MRAAGSDARGRRTHTHRTRRSGDGLPQYLARDGAYDDLNMTLQEALRHRLEVRDRNACAPTHEDGAADGNAAPTARAPVGHAPQDVFEGVHTCTEDETLASIFQLIAKVSFHRYARRARCVGHPRLP